MEPPKEGPPGLIARQPAGAAYKRIPVGSRRWALGKGGRQVVQDRPERGLIGQGQAHDRGLRNEAFGQRKLRRKDDHAALLSEQPWEQIPKATNDAPVHQRVMEVQENSEGRPDFTVHDVEHLHGLPGLHRRGIQPRWRDHTARGRSMRAAICSSAATARPSSCVTR